FFISFYLKKGNFGSVYGTASSFVAVLLWIYYSTQILLLGAEFTQVYTKRLGSHSKITKLK
ncbi:YihY/virulence factor BrkB family protein, partial [bacterium]|nr:YihY/virulence factor BrkB family protein [bacterium]